MLYDSLQGLTWVNDITSCLMVKMFSSNPYQLIGSCNEILNFGLSSHSECFADNKFCSVILPSLQNWRCLYDVYSPPNFFNKNGIAQVC